MSAAEETARAFEAARGRGIRRLPGRSGLLSLRGLLSLLSLRGRPGRLGWRRSRRRQAMTAAVAAAALVLTACSGLPTAGPVNPGLPSDQVPGVPDFAFRPNSPLPGASPEQIVTGFLQAATSPEGNWRIAKEFLTPEFAEQWAPTAGVTVYRPGDRAIEEVNGAVDVVVTVVASVDAAGGYTGTDPAESRLSYALEEVDGQWRISAAPEGIVLDRDFFADVYRAYPIMYFDPTWSFLVPDVRWFASRSPSLTTWIVRALVDLGPSAWLGGSVASAFPEEVGLADQSVTNQAGIARVELTDAVLQASPQIQARMQRQLESTLRSVGVTEVDMRVGPSSLEVEAAPVQSTAIDASPLVVAAGGAGSLTIDGLTPLAGGIEPAIVATTPETLALGRGSAVAAVLDGAGRALRVTDAATAVVDERAGQVAPTVDTAGYVWSVPTAQPTALRATGADGTPREIANAWPQAQRVWALQSAREGTRIAAAITEAGQDWLVVAGIIRDGNGVPVALGDAQRLARLDGAGYGVAWLDDQTVGVLVRGVDSTHLRVQTVGGLESDLSAPAGEIVALAAGATVAVPRVLDAEGVLYTRRGATWTQTATEIDVLGSQLGPL